MNSTILIERLTDSGTLFLLLSALIIVTAILGQTVRSVVASIVRERSRREIAAYIAEGSLTPEQGERLMTASNPGRKNA
jgi:Na+-transporting methylmalonyl-CoA/oxaloacetate decarboxylase gamma subunit